jgi:3-phosphoshikimate 1-carboxyvinyltransferase
MIEIRPLAHCDAVVTIPGSKSYTHRALIVSALADGESVLISALQSEDTGYTIQGLEKLGIQVFWKGELLHVLGKGGKLKSGEETIYVGNSGTSMRFLTALTSLKNGRTLLEGSERMRNRPIEDLLEGLRTLGARAYSKEGGNCPPVIVESQGLKGGTAKIREESSQFSLRTPDGCPYASTDVKLEVRVTWLLSLMWISPEVMSAFGVDVQAKDIIFLCGQEEVSPQAISG